MSAAVFSARGHGFVPIMLSGDLHRWFKDGTVPRAGDRVQAVVRSVHVDSLELELIADHADLRNQVDRIGLCLSIGDDEAVRRHLDRAFDILKLPPAHSRSLAFDLMLVLTTALGRGLL